MGSRSRTWNGRCRWSRYSPRIDMDIGIGIDIDIDIGQKRTIRGKAFIIN